MLKGYDQKKAVAFILKRMNPEPYTALSWEGMPALLAQCIEADFDFEGDIFSPELPRIVAEGFAFLMPYYRLFRQFRQEREENFSDR